MKAVLRGKFIALNTHLKKPEKSDTNELTEHLKTLEQKEVKLLLHLVKFGKKMLIEISMRILLRFLINSEKLVFW